MGLINFPNAKQTQNMNKSGCLRRIIIIAVVLFVAYYLMKSCGGGLLNMGNDTVQENTPTATTPSSIPSNTPTNTPTSTPTNTNNTITDSGDYSWIVGTWDGDMGAYGKIVLNFEGDGTSGRCSELKADGTYRYGSYQVNGDVLSYKLTGESFPTTIKIESGHRLSDGDGVYFHKKN